MVNKQEYKYFISLKLCIVVFFVILSFISVSLTVATSFLHFNFFSFLRSSCRISEKSTVLTLWVKCGTT